MKQLRRACRWTSTKKSSDQDGPLVTDNLVRSLMGHTRRFVSSCRWEFCKSRECRYNAKANEHYNTPHAFRPLVGACPEPGRTGAVRGHARAVRGHGLRRQPGVPGRPAEPGHRPSHRLSAVHNSGLGIQPPPSPGPGLPGQSVFGPGRRSHGRRVVPGRTPVGQQPAGRSHGQHGLCAQHHLVVAGYHRRSLHP